MRRHIERHRTQRIGWLRAAVLGANDGIVSTASLIVGVAAAGASSRSILVAGVAGLVAGAMSMAAGEYVSVSSQADTQDADLARERRELAADPEHEHQELAAIYVQRGLDPVLAAEVAVQLMKHDAIGAHARDELGISETLTALPVQAALASAATFAVGAVLPLILVLLFPASMLVWAVSIGSLVFLAVLGSLSARAGGASTAMATVRVTFWGALALALKQAQDRVAQVAPFTARVPGFDVPTGYAVAARVDEQRRAAGDVPVGRKIGFTNASLWPVYDVHQPIWGTMYERTLTRGVKGQMSVSAFAEPLIEPEIAFGLRSTPAKGSDPRELLRSIEWVAHGFEIVQSHFPGWKFKAADTVANNGLHGAYLLGPPLEVSRLRPH